MRFQAQTFAAFLAAVAAHAHFPPGVCAEHDAFVEQVALQDPPTMGESAGEALAPGRGVNAAITEAEAAAAVPFSERNFTDDMIVVPVDNLFGDWLGWRTELESSGITPSVTFVSDMLGNPVGGIRQGFTEADNVGVNALFDLEKRHGIEGGSFLATISQRSGNSLSTDYIGNTFQTQQVFGGPTFHVVDLAYRQKMWDDTVEIRAGRIGTSDDFLVSPYNYGFVQNGFCGTPVGIFINAPGMSGYPNATWGALLKTRPTERTYLMGGAYNGDTSIRDLNNHGLDFSLDGPLFAIAEAAYERNQLAGDEGLIGNYKFGAWWDGNEFPDLRSTALANAFPGAGIVPEMHEGNYGFYTVCDQVLIPFSQPGDEVLRGIGVVGAVIIAPDQSLSQMPYFFNAGVAARGIWASRARDVAAFGVVYGEFSDDLRAGQRQAQQLDPQVAVQYQEIALEWTYIFRFREGAYFIQPDVQYIIRPNGTDTIPNALVIGSQVGVNF